MFNFFLSHIRPDNEAIGVYAQTPAAVFLLQNEYLIPYPIPFDASYLPPNAPNAPDR